MRDDHLEYAVFDSVAVACGGAPESAEIAGAYFSLLRQLKIGSFNIAHVTKAENADQKPFGSVFWHNLARMTWYAKLADSSPSSHHEVTVGLYNRKNNLNRVYSAVGFRASFDEGRARFQRVNVADVQELADSLPLRQRMTHLLRSGPRTVAGMADELSAKVNSIEKVAKRGADAGRFTRLTGPDGVLRFALAERRTTVEAQP